MCSKIKYDSLHCALPGINVLKITLEVQLYGLLDTGQSNTSYSLSLNETLSNDVSGDLNSEVHSSKINQ